VKTDILGETNDSKVSKDVFFLFLSFWAKMKGPRITRIFSS
jgi:hypothetical protein